MQQYQLLSPEDTLVKLLDLGPLSHGDLLSITGWMPDKMQLALGRTQREGTVIYVPGSGGSYWSVTRLQREEQRDF